MANRVDVIDGVCVDGGARMTYDEQRELKALQQSLNRFELNGDVGRMVFHAVENAADERDPVTLAREQAVRQRQPRTGLGRIYDLIARRLWR